VKGDFMVLGRFILILFVVFSMSGCAGHRMALTKGQSDVDVKKKSIALISARISNQHKSKYQLDIVTTYICQPSQADCSRFTDGIYKTSSYNLIKSMEEGFNEYLLSFELESGTYNLDSMGAIYQSFLITGGGIVPLKFKFGIKPNSVIYLGHLDIVMRERKNDGEVRAGRIYPLIDQATIGASSGTFDVVVEDKFEEDVRLFVSEYPALQKVRIEKSLLPPWTRPKNELAN
jgi:hypothetical protein